MSTKSVLVLFLVALALTWPAHVKARTTRADPHAKRVKEQEAENKGWEKRAKSEETRLVKIADQYYKEKNYRKAREYYERTLDLRYKQWVFPVDASGAKQAARRTKRYKLETSHTRRASSRLKKMEETIKTQDLKDLMDAAEVATLQDNPVKAYKIYEDLIRAAERMGDELYAVRYAKKAKDQQKKLLAGASKALGEVEKLLKQSKAAEAQQKLNEVEAQYADLLKLSPELLDRFTSLGGAPEFAKQARERQVERRIRKGDAAMLREDYASAYRCYSQAARKYPGTKGAVVAVGKMAKLFGDPKIREAMKQQEIAAECKLLLARARAFLRMDRLTDAKAACDKIVVEYPQSEWAREAVEILEEIRKPDAQ